MLWSFIKVACFIVLIALLALGASWLTDSSGGIRIAAAGMEFTLGPLQAVIALLVLIVAIWLAIRVVGLLVAFFRFLAGDETALSRYFDRNRERKGFQALTEGLLAVASGEGKLAMAKARRAEKLLDRPALTNLLMAQAAETQGDTRTATEVYKRLLSDDRTRFVAVRGLMKQKLAEGDSETALRLAEKAFEMKPSHAEVQDTLLQLQTEAGQWAGARQTLAAKKRIGALPKDVHKRRDALLALQEAKGVLAEGSSIEAREAAITANRASPDLVPAAVIAANMYLGQERPRYATRVLKKAWEGQPHPDLAAAFAAIVPDEAPQDRLKRFETLFRANPAAEETALTRTELLIAAEEFPAARRSLGRLAETHPTARTLTLMAAIARGEGAPEEEVRGWLTRAVTASRGPQWICDNCQTVSADWAPVCPHCGGFDTLSWREAPDMPPLPNGAEMLPMIVGGPKPAQPVAAEPAPEVAAQDLSEVREVDPAPAAQVDQPQDGPSPLRDVTPPEPAEPVGPTEPTEPEAENAATPAAPVSEEPRGTVAEPAREMTFGKDVRKPQFVEDDPFAVPPAVRAMRGAEGEN